MVRRFLLIMLTLSVIWLFDCLVRYIHVVDHYCWRIWHRGRSSQEQMYGKCNNIIIQQSPAIADMMMSFDACSLEHWLGPSMGWFQWRI